MSDASIGYGMLFGISEDDGFTFPAVAEVFDITPPNETVDVIDVTHSTSPNRTREFISGLIDPGECTFEMNFVAGSASDIKIRGLTGVSKCQITFPNGVRWQFDGIRTGYEPAAPNDDKMTATVTFKVTSSVTSVAA